MSRIKAVSWSGLKNKKNPTNTCVRKKVELNVAKEQ